MASISKGLHGLGVLGLGLNRPAASSLEAGILSPDTGVCHQRGGFQLFVELVVDLGAGRDLRDGGAGPAQARSSGGPASSRGASTAGWRGLFDRRGGRCGHRGRGRCRQLRPQARVRALHRAWRPAEACASTTGEAVSRTCGRGAGQQGPPCAQAAPVARGQQAPAPESGEGGGACGAVWGPRMHRSQACA